MRLSWASYDIKKRSYDPLNFAIIGCVNWIIIGFWSVARGCNVRLYTGFDMDGHILTWFGVQKPRSHFCSTFSRWIAVTYFSSRKLRCDIAENSRTGHLVIYWEYNYKLKPSFTYRNVEFGLFLRNAENKSMNIDWLNDHELHLLHL